MQRETGPGWGGKADDEGPWVVCQGFGTLSYGQGAASEGFLSWGLTWSDFSGQAHVSSVNVGRRPKRVRLKVRDGEGPNEFCSLRSPSLILKSLLYNVI